MELQTAIDTVTSYLPFIPDLGEDGNDAIALVVFAAMAYEQATWRYQYEAHDASGASVWLDGFPSEGGVRQRRFRDSEGDFHYGSWSKIEIDTAHLERLVPGEVDYR